MAYNALGVYDHMSEMREIKTLAYIGIVGDLYMVLPGQPVQPEAVDLK